MGSDVVIAESLGTDSEIADVVGRLRSAGEPLRNAWCFSNTPRRVLSVRWWCGPIRPRCSLTPAPCSRVSVCKRRLTLTSTLGRWSESFRV